MVKLTKYILLACIVLTQQACVKDLQDDINDGGWNHERTIWIYNLKIRWDRPY
jgi:hypothetical protein